MFSASDVLLLRSVYRQLDADELNGAFYVYVR